ncbi:helix-turn-helix domain-containing protein [Amphritea pacifica]|uniref:helix-turn-helix domain-containing protein n=1 Tax=Amphritea pacifica TaxID=2811233 RepID=UPI0019636B31|nr:helix-turn-helix transcriptional regulator [Amphritea pacifica]MBN1008856.1 helix-turn-helix transcriptional regulator [Amphritea pacifica]
MSMTDLSSSSVQRDACVSGDEHQQRENLFTLLKQALKARGFTYARLAAEMNMSELSIKRLFKEKDCKMSRLLEVCSIIGLSIDELIQMQQRFRHIPEYLPESVEAALAADKQLFLILILLVSQVDIPTVGSLMEVDQARLYLYLRELEKLGIIELRSGVGFRFRVSLPIQWRMGGQLADLIKGINKRYIAHCLDHEKDSEYAFTTASRLMSKSSVLQIQNHLRRVREEFDYLSSQDQMFYKVEELQFYKLVFGMGPFPVDVILADE